MFSSIEIEFWTWARFCEDAKYLVFAHFSRCLLLSIFMCYCCDTSFSTDNFFTFELIPSSSSWFSFDVPKPYFMFVVFLFKVLEYVTLTKTIRFLLIKSAFIRIFMRRVHRKTKKNALWKRASNSIFSVFIVHFHRDFFISFGIHCIHDFFFTSIAFYNHIFLYAFADFVFLFVCVPVAIDTICKRKVFLYCDIYKDAPNLYIWCYRIFVW